MNNSLLHLTIPPDIHKIKVVEKITPVSFQKCYTCGLWHPVPGAYSGRFCSRECALSYRRCPVCGEYYPADSHPDGEFCSAECTGIDRQDRPADIVEIP
ncbi:MAG: hypothetical protein CSA76_02165 [Spirochaetales bacterium]|nr:MAG: hypothetical protein CSA76_02165 [Spirochaetales bacterium]